MNTIIIDKELYKKMSTREYYHCVDNFIFDEFAFIIADDDGNHNYAPIVVNLLKGTHMFTFLYPYGNYYVLPVKVNEEEHIGYSEKAFTNFIKYQGDKKEAEKSIAIWVFVIRSLVYYLLNYQRNRREIHSIPKKYSRKHRLSTGLNKIYLFDDVIKYIHDNYVSQGSHHNIQCPCWEVRGHYRHYKSGKVVFIPSYKKGKQRDKVPPKDKEYYA